MATYKVLSHKRLVALNSLAIRENREMTLHTGRLNSIDPTTIFPVTLEMGLEDCVRLEIGMDREGNRAYLDVSYDHIAHNPIPSIELPDEAVLLAELGVAFS
jgi:hypothetical protein